MSMFRATLWEDDGKAFEYTVRIEPMDKGDPWGGTVVWEHPNDNERPVLHRTRNSDRTNVDALGVDRPLAQGPRPEAVAPDRPAEPTLEAAIISPDEICEGGYAELRRLKEMALAAFNDEEVAPDRSATPQSGEIGFRKHSMWKPEAPDRPAAEEAELVKAKEALANACCDADIAMPFDEAQRLDNAIRKAAALIRSQAERIEAAERVCNDGWEMANKHSLVAKEATKRAERAEEAASDYAKASAHHFGALEQAQAEIAEMKKKDWDLENDALSRRLDEAQAEIARLREVLERIATAPVDGDAPYKPMEWARAALASMT